MGNQYGKLKERQQEITIPKKWRIYLKKSAPVEENGTKPELYKKNKAEQSHQATDKRNNENEKMKRLMPI